MTALGWIYVGFIVLMTASVLVTIARIGRPRKPLESSDAIAGLVVAAGYITVYLLTIRALS